MSRPGRRRAGAAAAALLALRAWAAHAAGGCDVERGRIGIGVAVRDGELVVAAVDAESPAARAGFRTGDVVLQVNDEVPRGCGKWSDAVEEARDDAKALLVLVLRDGAETALALGAGTWLPPPEVAAAEAGAEPGAPAGGEAAAPRPAPPVRPGTRTTATTLPVRPAAPPAPPPLPPDEPVSLAGVLDDLERLAPVDRPPDDLTAYRQAVVHVRRGVETLGARGLASPADVAALRRAVRYYEGAETAWDAVEGDRERERRSRRLPIAEGATVPYFSDSPVAVLIDEFDVLDATVAREPSGGPLGLQTSGLWRPVWARILLWERGARETAALRARLGGGAAPPPAAPD